jgi:tripartite-type tricarboxylate transporter receptor subunit TctC
VKVLARPDVKAALAAQGMDVMSGTPDQFATHIKSEIARMTKIAASAGIKAD